MLLRYNRSAKLEGLDWCICEISHNEQLEPSANVEIILRRLIEAAPAMCGNEALEVFIPFNSDRTLMAGEYFFARSPSKPVLERLRNVRGLAFIVKVRGAVVWTPDSYVQDLIAQAERDHNARSQNILCGSFVRIIDGFTRGYCGTVLNVSKDRMARIKVDLLTRSFVTTTPMGNLENISHVPRANRVFYCQSKGARPHAGRDSVQKQELARR